jgi:hypothetical protein
VREHFRDTEANPRAIETEMVGLGRSAPPPGREESRIFARRILPLHFSAWGHARYGEGRWQRIVAECAEAMVSEFAKFAEDSPGAS